MGFQLLPIHATSGRDSRQDALKFTNDAPSLCRAPGRFFLLCIFVELPLCCRQSPLISIALLLPLPIPCMKLGSTSFFNRTLVSACDEFDTYPSPRAGPPFGTLPGHSVHRVL